MFPLSVSLLLLFWSPQAVQPQVQPPGGPTTEPTTQPTYDEGPLQVELIAMREIRYHFVDPEQAKRARSELDMQFRVRGERLTQIVRAGKVIFSELVDDTGQSLIDPNTYTEADRTGTRPVTYPAEQLRTLGLITTTQNNPSTRGSLALSRVRGSIRVVIAPDTEKVTIANPTALYGKKIVNPRLAALGIEIEIVPLDQIENAPPANRGLLLRYVANGEHILKASFVDGNMRPIPTRESAMTLKTGEQAQLYYFDASPLNDEVQLVLDVLPKVDEVVLPIELDGLKLP
jgi:hypothetical protein